MKRITIVGAGPAGYSAGIYCARAGLQTRMLTGAMVGGQLSTTLHIENYPGYRGQGTEKLIGDMHEQCVELGVEMIRLKAKKIEGLSVIDELEVKHESDAVIIATGALPKRLEVKGEEKYFSKGVSTCATCDGSFYRGKKVAVIGGGNTAVEDAIYLSGLAGKVYLIHRRDKLRAEKMLQEKLFRLKNVSFCWEKRVEEFYGGGEYLEGVRLSDGSEIEVDGAFVAVGHVPNTEWCKDVVEVDSEGYVKSYPETNVEGVFAAGDVGDKEYRQAITAAGQGCMAAMKAVKWLGG